MRAGLPSSNIKITDITFTGSILAYILDIFKSVIASFLTSTLHSLLDTAVTTLININLTDAMVWYIF